MKLILKFHDGTQEKQYVKTAEEAVLLFNQRARFKDIKAALLIDGKEYYPIYGATPEKTYLQKFILWLRYKFSSHARTTN